MGDAMNRNVLVVDDDRILRLVIQKKLKRYADVFTVLTAENGVDAVEKLRTHPVSLVVTDLQMPEMDGFALLAYLTENFPEIPAIVFTGLPLPQSQRTALELGYAGYIEKPIVFEDLQQLILAALQAQSEGGMLKTVSLEVFTQLIEMEQKTCTIRVADKESDQQGVLFFHNGELWDARLRDRQGEQAAYDIFSWDKVTLSIQEVCPVAEKKVESDLQAILLEAMRLKDEKASKNDVPDELDETPTAALEAALKEARVCRSHGLHREALAIYNKIISRIDSFDQGWQQRIRAEIRGFRQEIKSHFQLD
jgi:CheY-like chemotaxis protein